MTAAAKGRSFLSLAAVVALMAAVLGVAPAEASRYLPSPLNAALEPPTPSVDELPGVRGRAEALHLLSLDDELLVTSALFLEAHEYEQLTASRQLRALSPDRHVERVLEAVWARKHASGGESARSTTISLDLKALNLDLRLPRQMDPLNGRFPGGQSMLFQGLWTDPTTGLSYARNRWYDARNASWLSEDPLRDVDSPNLYAFVGWGPHVYTDPMGECGVLCVQAFGWLWKNREQATALAVDAVPVAYAAVRATEVQVGVGAAKLAYGAADQAVNNLTLGAPAGVKAATDEILSGGSLGDAASAGLGAAADKITYGYATADDRWLHTKDLVGGALGAGHYSLGIQDIVEGIPEGKVEQVLRGGSELALGMSQTTLVVAGTAETGVQGFRLFRKPTVPARGPIFDHRLNHGRGGWRDSATGRIRGAREPTAGQKVYRVYGGDSAPGGACWSPVDPRSVPNYRDAAGLPSGGASGYNNTGRFVIEGTLTDPSKVVKTRAALQLDGNRGGIPEYIIPNALDSGAVRVDRVSGVNPEF